MALCNPSLVYTYLLSILFCPYLVFNNRDMMDMFFHCIHYKSSDMIDMVVAKQIFMFMFYLFHYNKSLCSLYKGTMCLRMFHRCCIVSPLIRRMAGLGISFHILVLYVSLLIHQIQGSRLLPINPEVEHIQEFPKPGWHLDFFDK